MAGSSHKLQQDFLNYREYTNKKLQHIDEKMDKFMDRMTKMMRHRSLDFDEGFDNPFGEHRRERGSGNIGERKDKGVFRDPLHVEKERAGRYEEDDVPWRRRNQNNENEERAENLNTLNWFFHCLQKVKMLIQDCEEYFSIYGINSQRRIAIAGMHLHGSPKFWYKSFVNNKDGLTWSEFAEDFNVRFTEAGAENEYEQFKLLKQVGTVNEYYDEFERYKGRLLQKLPHLTEDYFVGNFIGELTEETKKMVKLLGPGTLSQAFKQAKLYESPIPKPINSYQKSQSPH